MKKKWKILLACVVIVTVACAAAWYLLPRPAVGEDYEVQYINVGETLENITGQIDQNTCNALNDLLRQTERRGYRRNVFPRQLREDTVQIIGVDSNGPWFFELDGEACVLCDGQRGGYPIIDGEGLLKQAWALLRTVTGEGCACEKKVEIPAVVRCRRGSPGWLFLLLPAPAVGEGFQLLEVRQDGRDLTASLRPEQLADLEATMRGASRFRWKNPIGVYPLEADTVTLLGANGESVILVGSQGRFAVDGYPLHDGETLLAEVQNILAS